MVFSFRHQYREPRVVDTALEGGFLYVSNDECLTVWDLRKGRQSRSVTMDNPVMRGTRRLMFPYLFYRVDRADARPDAPPEWFCMVLDERIQPHSRRIQLDVDTFFKG